MSEEEGEREFSGRVRKIGEQGELGGDGSGRTSCSCLYGPLY